MVWDFDDGSGNKIIQAVTRAAGGSFGPPVNLSVAGWDSGVPQVAIAPDGTTTVVWYSKHGAGSFIIQAATRPPGGSLPSPPAPVNLSVPGRDAYDPQIDAAPDGTVTAVWNRLDASGHNVIQAATRAPGGSFGTPRNISVHGQSATHPRIAGSADGRATVVWQRSDGSHTVIQAVTRPPGGSFPDPPAPVNLSASGQNAIFPQVVASPDGTTTSIWQRSNGSHYMIQASTRPPGGSFLTPIGLSAPGQEAERPQVTVAPDGRVTAVWQRYDGFDDIIQKASTQPPRFPLLVTRTGNAHGSVTSSPAGIDCGDSCSSYFAAYAEVTLTATPDAGNHFTGWSGACSGSASTCRVTMAEARAVNAGFAADAPPPARAKISKLKLRPRKGKLRAGKRVRLKVKVTNSGNAPAKNVKVHLKSSNKRVKVKKKLRIKRIAPGKTKSVKIKVKARGRAKGKAKITAKVAGRKAHAKLKIKARRHVGHRGHS